MRNTLADIWPLILEKVRDQIGRERFNLWFKNVNISNYKDNYVNIVVPNPFVKERFEEVFSSILKENIKNSISKDVDINFSVSEEGPAELKNAQSKEDGGHDQGDIKDLHCTSLTRPAERSLTLEDFVVGNCNRLAYASALELIKPDSHSFDVLFIHGTVGIGKTHLLRGIHNKIKEKKNGVDAKYLTAESWTNDFVYSLQNGKLEGFRHKYRNTDILLIDDVHFFSNKQGVQEELIHTFNALHGSSKRFVFASDSHPRFINKLKESLVSRFMAGIVTKMESPDFNTAYLILVSKLKKIDKEVTQDVLEYIAETFRNNIRELEGAITTVLAVAEINKKKIDVSLARDALEEHISPKNRLITIKDIEEVVSEYFNITLAELHSSRRTEAVSFPRQIAMYLATVLTNLSRQQIGDHLGGKKHATVIHAVKKIKAKIDQDKKFQCMIEDIKNEIHKDKKK